MKNKGMLLLMFAAFAVAVKAQDDTIRVATNLVTLNVSVADKKGGFAGGLTRNDFRLTDNGKVQEIESFSDGSAPVSFGVVYDLHPTTDEQTKSVLEALRSFSRRLGSDDDLFVTVFNERGSLTTDFVPTEEQIHRQVDSGAKSLYDAIFAAANKMSLSARNHKRVLLVLTDGADHNSEHSYKQLKNRLRSVNLPVYAITFGGTNNRQMYSYSDLVGNGRREFFRYGEANELDKAAVADLAKASGGRSYDGNMRNQVYVAALCHKVADEVKGQYVLGFYPDVLDGKFHKLKVSVARQKERRLKVSNRKGYQSPK